MNGGSSSSCDNRSPSGKVIGFQSCHLRLKDGNRDVFLCNFLGLFVENDMEKVGFLRRIRFIGVDFPVVYVKHDVSTIPIRSRSSD